jgi:hypothetical protein
MRFALPTCILIALLVHLAAADETKVSTIDALKRAMRQAKPGDAILIAPGRYAAPKGQKVFYMQDVHGTAEKPIVVRAADPADRPVFADASECFHLNHCSHLVVEGIITEGAHVNNFQFDFCDHLVVRDGISRNMAATLNGGNCDGIKIPGSSDLLFYRCSIENWGWNGSGIDMVGCARILMAECRFTFPTGTKGGPNATQPKSGTRGFGVYRSRVDDASLRAVQFGGAGKPAHIGSNEKMSGLDQMAMGNVIIAGECPLVFASAQDSIFAYNTVVNPTRNFCRILKEGPYGFMSNNKVDRNLIVYDRDLLFLTHSDGTTLDSVAFAANYWYNSNAPDRSIPRLPIVEKDPAGGADPKLDKDYRPPADSPAAAYGAYAPAMEAEWAKHTDWFKWAWAQYQQIKQQEKPKDAPQGP